jgi:hypothetical protein
MLRYVSVLLGALFVLSPLSPANAQQACGERTKFTLKLEETFSERPVAMGLTDKGAVLEVFASKHGSWTFLITMPSGLTCVVASGQSWESISATQADQSS